jgi:hypothetical protein
MILIRILILATTLVIIGYFIQFAAQRAEGFLKPFGKYLSLWVFVLAGLIVVAAALQPVLGDRGFGMTRGGPGFARAFAPGPGFFPGRRFDRRFDSRPDGQPGGRFGRRAARGAPPPADGSATTPAPQPTPTNP